MSSLFALLFSKKAKDREKKAWANMQELKTRQIALADRMQVLHDANILLPWCFQELGWVPIMEALLDRIEKLEAKL